MRDEKKEASKVKQTNKAKQHSTPKAVTFPIKNGAASTHDTLYSRQSALPAELPRQLGPNFTSNSTPDVQANHQVSMKEKAMYTMMRGHIKGSAGVLYRVSHRSASVI